MYAPEHQARALHEDHILAMYHVHSGSGAEARAYHRKSKKNTLLAWAAYLCGQPCFLWPYGLDVPEHVPGQNRMAMRASRFCS